MPGMVAGVSEPCRMPARLPASCSRPIIAGANLRSGFLLHGSCEHDRLAGLDAFFPRHDDLELAEHTFSLADQIFAIAAILDLAAPALEAQNAILQRSLAPEDRGFEIGAAERPISIEHLDLTIGADPGHIEIMAPIAVPGTILPDPEEPLGLIRQLGRRAFDRERIKEVHRIAFRIQQVSRIGYRNGFGLFAAAASNCEDGKNRHISCHLLTISLSPGCIVHSDFSGRIPDQRPSGEMPCDADDKHAPDPGRECSEHGRHLLFSLMINGIPASSRPRPLRGSGLPACLALCCPGSGAPESAVIARIALPSLAMLSDLLGPMPRRGRQRQMARAPGEDGAMSRGTRGAGGRRG